MIRPNDISCDVSLDDDNLEVRAFWKQEHEIALADCMLLPGNAVKLVDIKFDPVCQLSATGIAKIFSKPIRAADLRGLGIGSRLLELVISESKMVGADEIWGSVVESDLQQNRNLLGWYQQHGFQVLTLLAALNFER